MDLEESEQGKHQFAVADVIVALGGLSVRAGSGDSHTSLKLTVLSEALGPESLSLPGRHHHGNPVCLGPHIWVKPRGFPVLCLSGNKSHDQGRFCFMP